MDQLLSCWTRAWPCQGQQEGSAADESKNARWQGYASSCTRCSCPRGAGTVCAELAANWPSWWRVQGGSTAIAPWLPQSAPGPQDPPGTQQLCHIHAVGEGTGDRRLTCGPTEGASRDVDVFDTEDFVAQAWRMAAEATSFFDELGMDALRHEAKLTGQGCCSSCKRARCPR